MNTSSATTTWTAPALEALERYLADARAQAARDGADPQEVGDDLRRHVEAELAAAGVYFVTADALQRVLSKIGPAEHREEPESLSALIQKTLPPDFKSPQMREARRWAGTAALVLFGVLIPIAALVVELLGGECARLFLDPIPTPWHAVLIAIVPAANIWVLLATSKPTVRRRSLLSFVNAVALGISACYAVLFIPMLPLAAVGIILVGLGLLPMSPLTAFLAAVSLRRRLRRWTSDGEAARAPWLFQGLGAAALALAVASAPLLITAVGLDMATSSDPATSKQGVRLLRKWGDEGQLLSACYSPWRGGGAWNLVDTGITQPITVDKAREVYFRVTGKAFDGQSVTRVLGGSRFDGVTDDAADRGGDRVGQKLAYLSLTESRLDGVIEAQAAVAYVEWTMVFHNDSAAPAEARARIALPSDGVVSRVTLWVDGEEREAAFAGKAQARAAYQRVVRVERRDPLLVNTAGPDTALVQCFPVPPKGQMKIRIGITAPMTLDPAGQVRLYPPALLDSNFGVKAGVKHSLWFEATDPLSDPAGLLKAVKSEKRPHGLRGEVSDAELGGGLVGVTAQRDAGKPVAWCTSRVKKEGTGGFIVQVIEPASAEPPQRLVIVIDGSAPMGEVRQRIIDLLAAAPKEMELAVVVSADEVVELTDSAQSVTPELIQRVSEKLRAVEMAGGVDAIAGVCRGWDIASEVGDGVVLWLHGPQPVVLGDIEKLKQRLERSGGPRVWVAEAAPGVNRILEAVDESGRVERLPGPRDGIRAAKDFLASMNGGGQAWRAVRTRAQEAPQGSQSVTASDHLERLWAAERVRRHLKSRAAADHKLAADLAAAHQLVTPASGAVVLETQQDYVASGLTPPDPAKSPSVPEPGVMVTALAAAAWLLRRPARSRRADAPPAPSTGP